MKLQSSDLQNAQNDFVEKPTKVQLLEEVYLGGLPPNQNKNQIWTVFSSK